MTFLSLLSFYISTKTGGEFPERSSGTEVVSNPENLRAPLAKRVISSPCVSYLGDGSHECRYRRKGLLNVVAFSVTNTTSPPGRSDPEMQGRNRRATPGPDKVGTGDSPKVHLSGPVPGMLWLVPSIVGIKGLFF